MVYKSTCETKTGHLTTMIVRGDGTPTFRITSFKMSDYFAKEQKIDRPIRSVEVSLFDSDSAEWKVIVPTGIFTHEDCMAMQEEGKMLDKVQEFLKDFFGICFSW